MEARSDDESTAAVPLGGPPHDLPAGAGWPASAELRPDTAVSPVIRGEPVAIPTPAWGSAIVVDDDEVVIAELVDDEAVPSAAAGGPSAAAGPSAAGGQGAAHAAEPEPASGRARLLPVVGWTAAALALATAVLTGVAVQVDSTGAHAAATTLAWVAIGLSAATVVVGIGAAFARRSRVVGLLAAFAGVIANPWILLQILTFFSS